MLFGKHRPHVVTDEKQVDEVLTRGVAEVLPTKKELKTVLLSGARMRLYQGFDPTGVQLHIGHMIGLRKLAQFQALGHEVIFVIGDGTGQAGDPSGKTTGRDTFLTTEELKENAKSYIQQAASIMQFKGNNPVQVKFNSTWLNALGLTDILSIAENFSLQQLSERSVFQERMARGESVSMREFLYPLLQAYDSVALAVDLEIGGTDQTFNMLAGRTLSRKMLNKEKYVLTTPLLADSQGKKIGKTEGNVIGLTDEPNDLYGKIMALGDDVIVKGFEYLTDVPMDDVQAIAAALKHENPKQYKERLAFEIVKQLYDEDAAKQAKAAFTETFAKGNIPDNVETLSQKENVRNTVVAASIVDSNSDWNRLVAAGAVRNMETEERVADPDIVVENTTVLRIGKKRFVRITAD